MMLPRKSMYPRIRYLGLGNGNCSAGSGGIYDYLILGSLGFRYEVTRLVSI